MPPISRWMLKTSLIYFIIALIVGVLQSAVRWIDPGGTLVIFRQLEPVRLHLLVIGWITQLILGVAFWMFPKYSQAKPRGSIRLGWAAYILLNIGLILRAVGESAGQPGTIFGWMLVASALFLWLAGLAFFLNIWPRIKEK